MELNKNPVTVIIPPKIQIAMTGAWKAEKGPTFTTLFYVDGSQEKAANATIDATCDWQEWFSIVGAVQAAARA